MTTKIFGFVRPGQTITRALVPPVPAGRQPVLQNRPGGTVRLVGFDRAAMTITLSNAPDSPDRLGAYLVLFADEETLKRLLAARKVVDAIKEGLS